MSEDTKNISPAPENTSGQSASVPMWIFMLTLLLLFLGGVYFDRHSGWFDAQVYSPYENADQLEAYQPKSGAAEALARGKRLYELNCGTCHGVDGMGKPNQAPPLSGSEWVKAKGVERLVHIPLSGVGGVIKVNGQEWNLQMAAMGAALSDTDLAAVLTYIRGSWDNGMGEVTADDVKSVRATIGDHPKQMTGDEMMKMPE